MRTGSNSTPSRLAERILRTPALMRAPIRVYRAGLGFLFGSRLLMLEHVGRRTGVTRYVVLEVLGHPSAEVYLVPSGFGERSQWFQNVLAHPEVKVSVAGRRGVPATVRRLSTGEADAALRRYIDRHPRAWATLGGVLDRTLNGRVAPPGTELPVIELRIK